MTREKIQLTELRELFFQLVALLGYDVVENFTETTIKVRPHLQRSELLASYRVVRRG